MSSCESDHRDSQRGQHLHRDATRTQNLCIGPGVLQAIVSRSGLRFQWPQARHAYAPLQAN